MKIDSIVLRKLFLMYLAYVVFLVGCKMLFTMSSDKVMNRHESVQGAEAVSMSVIADDKPTYTGISN